MILSREASLVSLVRDEEEEYDINVESLIESIKPEGRYQIWMVIYISLLSINCAFMIYSVAFFFYVPEFQCFTDESKSNWTICPETEACESKFGFGVLSSRTSLITEYSLYCDRGDIYVWALSFMFYYNAIVAFFISLTVDSLGRKFAMLLSVGLTIVASGLGIVGNSLEIQVFAIANLFVAFDLFYNSSTIWTVESIGGALRHKANSIAYVAYGFGVAGFFVINSYLTSYDTIFWIIFCIATVLLPAGLLFHESPAFLLKQGRISEMYEVISKIARFNGTRFSRPELTASGMKHEHRVDITPFWVKFGKYKWVYACLTVIGANLSMLYSLISLIPQFAGGKSMYVNGVLIAGVEIIGYGLISTFASSWPRKKINLYGTCIFILGGASLFVSAKFWGRTGYILYFELAVCLTITLALCITYGIFYTFAVESFPSSIRGKCLASMVLLERFFCMLSGYFVRKGHLSNINPFSFITLTSIIPLIALLGLRETLGQRLL